MEAGHREAVSWKNRGSEMPAKVTECLFLEASKEMGDISVEGVSSHPHPGRAGTGDIRNP